MLSFGDYHTFTINELHFARDLIFGEEQIFKIDFSQIGRLYIILELQNWVLAKILAIV